MENAIVTGATRGLGNSIAWFLAEKGFQLFLVARNAAALLQLKSEIEKKHNVNVQVFDADFSSPSEIEKLSKELKSEIKSIDIIVNNAGAFEFGTLDESSLEQAQRLFNTNALAAFSITNTLIPVLKQQQAGHVFNIGSIVTQHPRKDIAAYTLSKFALKGFTEVLRDELKDHNVKVTELIPGSINTSSWDNVEGVPKEDFIQTQELVDAIWMCYNNTAASNVESMVIRPLNREF